jgi:NAD(P)-dependent dehydrogenase (short-subunit alcohol dehydrogenase family)
VEDLAGKTAVVTGAGSGIGRAVALNLARNGMRVAILDIQADNAEQVAAEARRGGAEAWAAACDVSDGDATADLVRSFGPIGVLIANAGVTAFEPFAEMRESDIDWIYGVNFLGVSRLLRTVLPGMIAAGEGHVVVTSSMAGLVPTWAPIHAPYVATKAGALGMVLNLRPELAAHGVGCTVVCPGGVATNILDAPKRRPDRFGGASTSPIEPPKGFGSPSAPRHRQRTPEEVAAMI